MTHLLQHPFTRKSVSSDEMLALFRIFAKEFNIYLIDMLEIGLKHQSVMRVMEGNTAEFIGSGDMAVLATPAMIALMENAAMLAVALKIEESETTVGSMISTTHLKPSKVGNTVSAIAELTAIEGRKLTFKIEAYDGETLIGEGEHVRYIVNREKFLSKL